MKRKGVVFAKISVEALKGLNVLFAGDVYELAHFLLKMDDAKQKHGGFRGRYTVNGLAAMYAKIAGMDHDEMLSIFEFYRLPMGATVEYDEDVAG